MGKQIIKWWLALLFILVSLLPLPAVVEIIGPDLLILLGLCTPVPLYLAIRFGRGLAAPSRSGASHLIRGLIIKASLYFLLSVAYFFSILVVWYDLHNAANAFSMRL
ncbi:MAG TPA: hypothetical protein VFD58_28645 [Blastocatellia bacterium]|nr:hypothetical protein [Blastocatellia bacterium]